MSNPRISDERHLAFQLGTGCMVIGGLMFASFFVGIAMMFSGANAKHMPTVIWVTLAGFVLLGVGRFLRHIGQVGLAGSGVVLDPDQARKDVAPWTRAVGGALGDTLKEAGLAQPAASPSPTPVAVAALPFDEQIRRLDSLRKEGLITTEEYEVARRKILDSIASAKSA